jgi:nucleotide-binding universal stress UspA family protein
VKVLAAYDGTPGADAVLDDLGRAGLPDATAILVLTVAHEALEIPASLVALVGAEGAPSAADARATGAAAAMETARRVNDGAVAILRDRFPRGAVSGRVSGGAAASAIVLHADAWAPDLVVVGSRGRARPLRLLLGSVARKVVTEARCSVRVARPVRPVAPRAARVLVGHDGREGGRAALRAAAERSWPEGSTLHVLCARPPELVTFYANAGDPRVAWPAPDAAPDAAAARRIVDADVAAARRVGLAVTATYRTGDPERVLLRAARTWDVDAVFVGATGLGRLERFLLGSVASAVADRARCSVEVVREARR